MTRLARLFSVARARQLDVTVVMDRVSRELNVAQVVRSADAFGVQRVLAMAPDGKYARSFLTASTGSAHWVDVRIAKSYEEVLADARERGQRIVATCFSARAVRLDRADLASPVALVFGAELDGVSRTLLEAADTHITIPMCGMTQSLNVSVAAGVVLAEMHRQRCERAATLGEQGRGACGMGTAGDPSSVRGLVFRWLYPELSERGRAAGLTAPAVDAGGLIVGRMEWFDELRAREHAATHATAANDT